MKSSLWDLPLCILLFLCTINAEMSETEKDDSITLTAINDSAYLVNFNKRSKHENISDALYLFNEPSNLNTIIEKSFSASDKDSPLRKREILSHVSHSKFPKSEEARGFFDGLFTLYYDENVNGSYSMLSRPKKQAGDEYYRKISDTLQNSSSSEEKKPLSVISYFKDKTLKARQEKEKSDITVIPMPLLTNTFDENVVENSVNVRESDVTLIGSRTTPIRPEEVSITEDIFRSDDISEEKTIISTAPDLIYTTAEPIHPVFSSSHTPENPPSAELNDNEKIGFEEIVTQESNFLSNSEETEEHTMQPNIVKNIGQTDRQHTNEVATNYEKLLDSNYSNTNYDSETSTTKHVASMIENNFKEPKRSIANTTTLSSSSITKTTTTTTTYTASTASTTSSTASTTTTGISFRDTFGHIKFHNHTHLVFGGSKESTSTPEISDVSNNQRSSTITPFVVRSRTPNLSLAEVKIIPVQEREYTLLMSGIILCSLGVIMIAGGLIIYFYQRRKSSSQDIEMMSSIRIEEETM